MKVIIYQSRRLVVEKQKTRFVKIIQM